MVVMFVIMQKLYSSWKRNCKFSVFIYCLKQIEEQQKLTYWWLKSGGFEEEIQANDGGFRSFTSPENSEPGPLNATLCRELLASPGWIT